MLENQNKPIDIQPGFYTIVYPNGEHRTMRVKKPKQGYFAGHTIIGFLYGSDNISNYRFFGTLAHGRLVIWNTFAQTVDDLKLQRIRRAVNIINNDPAEKGKAYALNSGRCYVCNRLLTHPESIMDGIGPECSSKQKAIASRRAA